MQVLRSLEAMASWRAEAGSHTVATIGNFDGVHRAHRQLLEATLREAAGSGARTVAVSFEPHPSRVLHPETAPPLITPAPEKIRLIAAAGMDALLLLPFNRDLSLWSPREFVERVVVAGLRVRSMHEGGNFRFGHRHAGTVETLQALGTEFSFAVHLHPQIQVRGEIVSSSRIRELVAGGEVARARHLLGRPFGVHGHIARGRGVGRQRTVPTLNLQHYEDLLPGVGVYLTLVQLNGEARAALTNVGVRPTFGAGGPLTVETHVLHPPLEGLDPAIGEWIDISFLGRLRDERRFETADTLRAQIQHDIGTAEEYFRRIGIR
ncbi:MAG: riboflavin biosynthesis protein RibF, partial [Streptosporangiaceae bacterium]